MMLSSHCIYITALIVVCWWICSVFFIFNCLTLCLSLLVPLATTPVLGASTPGDPTSQLHVSWEVTSSNPTSGLIYMVQLGTDTAVAATSPKILESLSPGTQYTVTLWSVAGQGTTGSATSATSQASDYTSELCESVISWYMYYVGDMCIMKSLEVNYCPSDYVCICYSTKCCYIWKGSCPTCSVLKINIYFPCKCPGILQNQDMS